MHVHILVWQVWGIIILHCAEIDLGCGRAVCCKPKHTSARCWMGWLVLPWNFFFLTHMAWHLLHVQVHSEIL